MDFSFLLFEELCFYCLLEEKKYKSAKVDSVDLAKSVVDLFGEDFFPIFFCHHKLTKYESQNLKEQIRFKQSILL